MKEADDGPGRRRFVGLIGLRLFREVRPLLHQIFFVRANYVESQVLVKVEYRLSFGPLESTIACRP